MTMITSFSENGKTSPLSPNITGKDVFQAFLI